MDRQIACKLSEVRELLKLANSLHATADSASRKRRMLEGLCRLSRAHAAACIVTQEDPCSGQNSTISRVEHATGDCVPLVDAKLDGFDSIPLSAVLHSVVRLPGTGVTARIVLAGRDRRWRRSRNRHHRLIHAFHNEMKWVYQADVVLASPDTCELPPRARQTLEHLLAGQSEKQIATRLRVSRNTVHHYVKQIYRHFHVSSRSELLAMWVGK